MPRQRAPSSDGSKESTIRVKPKPPKRSKTVDIYESLHAAKEHPATHRHRLKAGEEASSIDSNKSYHGPMPRALSGSKKSPPSSSSSSLGNDIESLRAQLQQALDDLSRVERERDESMALSEKKDAEIQRLKDEAKRAARKHEETKARNRREIGLLTEIKNKETSDALRKGELEVEEWKKKAAAFDRKAKETHDRLDKQEKGVTELLEQKEKVLDQKIERIRILESEKKDLIVKLENFMLSRKPSKRL